MSETVRVYKTGYGAWNFGLDWAWHCPCCLEGDDGRTWQETLTSALDHVARDNMWHGNTPGALAAAR